MSNYIAVDQRLLEEIEAYLEACVKENRSQENHSILDLLFGKDDDSILLLDEIREVLGKKPYDDE